jgi:hypothetical protein
MILDFGSWGQTHHRRRLQGVFCGGQGIFNVIYLEWCLYMHRGLGHGVCMQKGLQIAEERIEKIIGGTWLVTRRGQEVV